MPSLWGVLVIFLAGSAANIMAQSNNSAKVIKYARTLPAVSAPLFDEQKKETLASLAISCADHPHENTGTHNNYLWCYEKMPTVLENYDRNRAFFGWGTWHDASVIRG
jgi:hypothetical protein